MLSCTQIHSFKTRFETETDALHLKKIFEILTIFNFTHPVKSLAWDAEKNNEM